MKEKNLGKLAELIGLVSIVAGLILVAWEVHQANNIAKAQMVMELAAQANEFNSATYGNPQVAELARAMSDPNQIDVSETQAWMMSGVAWHIENHPGLKPTFMKVYDTAPWIRDMYVFQPLVEMVCESRNNCVDSR